MKIDSLKGNIVNLAQYKYLNRWVVFCMDAFVSVLVTLLSYLFVLYVSVTDINRYTLVCLSIASLFASSFSFLLWGVYKHILRHTTLQEIWRLALVAFFKIFFILFFIAWLHVGLNHKQLLVGIIIDGLTTMVCLITIRVLLINFYTLIQHVSYSNRKKILVYGIDDASVAIGNNLSSAYTRHYNFCGYLFFDSRRNSFRISGQPVYTITDYHSFSLLAGRLRLQGILFPDDRIVQNEKERLVRFCEKKKMEMFIVPPLEEINNGVRLSTRIREIQVEDLLGREEIKINLKEIAGSLQTKVVMVTGAAGSIGSELCRQLAMFDIKQLILFDSAETPMHTIRLELEEQFPRLHFVPIIGDVRHEQRVNFVFHTYHPQVVFHAAAYKHVPLMEINPCEAINVNVHGTRIMADYALKYEVEKFVMISTDKAVNPTNIMGASKRLAEIYVQSLNIAITQGKVQGLTRFITTRFGNVLGSNGSVIPRFRQQIKKGGPVTVTHPDILRYFMTIPEACRLVMEAAIMGKGAEIFVFDMGEPVKIVDLAYRMIELAGYVPEKDISIEYTGLRPGEKLYEELLSNEENTLPTVHEKIRIATVRKYDYTDVCLAFERLIRLSQEMKIPETVKLMKQIVPEFISKNSIYEKLDHTEPLSA